ncbi:MAG TPA: polymer-forming cytoskeletal protein, partial [Vicinamibacteria bacterium]
MLSAAALAIAGIPLAGSAGAQANAVVSSEVTVSGERASLQLELESGELISVVFSEGAVEVDGDMIGEYQEGGDLERSWRALLGEAASLEPAQIPSLVAGWTPPAGLQGEVAEVAEQVRLRLSLQGTVTTPALQNPDGAVATGLQALMGRAERLRALAAISDQVDIDAVRVHVGEDVAVALGETVESTLVVVDGDVRIDGTVDGDLVLLGADAELGPDGRVTGSVFHSDGEIEGDLDGIEGEVDEIDVPALGLSAPDVPARPSVPDVPDRLSLEVEPAFRSIRGGFVGLLR